MGFVLYCLFLFLLAWAYYPSLSCPYHLLSLGVTFPGVCMYVWMHGCMYMNCPFSFYFFAPLSLVCMYGCMYACMHVCMYVCIHALLSLVCLYASATMSTLLSFL